MRCACAERVPVAPAVGAVHPDLCLVLWWYKLRGDTRVVSWLDACRALWSEGCCLRLVQHCWPALMVWRFLCVCTLRGFLL